MNLLNRRIHKISLAAKEENDAPKKSKKELKSISAELKINNELYLNKNDSKLFRVRYFVDVSLNNNLHIDLAYDFDFRAEDDVDQSLAKSLIIRSQVPNLVYPYIKTYIEHFLLMSGYGSIPLPYVDFIKNPIATEK